MSNRTDELAPPLSIKVEAPKPALPQSGVKVELAALSVHRDEKAKPLIPVPGRPTTPPVTPALSLPPQFKSPPPGPRTVTISLESMPGAPWQQVENGVAVKVVKTQIAEWYAHMRKQLDEQYAFHTRPEPEKPRELDIRVTESGEVQVTKKR